MTIQRQYSFNQTQAYFPLQSTIAELFEQQVVETPNHVALVFGDGVNAPQSITYAQLNRQANVLAHQLIAQGVGADILVGVSVERSIAMLVAIFAVLKAGGAYVPLDPDYPEGRLAYLVEDAGVELILTQRSLSALLQPLGAKLIYIDATTVDTAPEFELNPLRRNGPNDLAYVIYTSGSTGKPKGVMIEQVSVVNMIYGFNRVYQTTERDTAVLQASISFDVSVGESLPILCRGGTLAIPAKSVVQDPAEFERFLKTHQVSIFGSTPSLLANLNFAQMPHLRLIFSGGEAMLLHNIEQLLSVAVLVNGYGPTEATVGATAFILGQETLSRYPSVPIGKPVANYQTYVLDDDLMPLPIGEKGRLYIGGIGLARGYLHRAELTAQKFVEIDIFGERQRLYDTGDLAAWTEDGNLLFYGRADFQLKIRGFRIEPGEIERAMCAFDGIEQAVVTGLTQGEHQLLVGYVVTSKQWQPEVIKAKLAKQLPRHMVPSRIIIVDKMPLSVNGKVDLNALPKPAFVQSAVNDEALTNRQQCLKDIWQQVLGVENIALEDNFFTLGGDSIAAIQIVARLRKHGLSLSVKQLFTLPTIKALADCLIESTPSTAQGWMVERVHPAWQQAFEVEAVFAATSLQQGMVYNQAANPDDNAYRIQVLMDYHCALAVEHYRQAWLLVCQHFPVMRLGFDWQQQMMQVVARQARFTPQQFVFHDLSSFTQSEQQKFIEQTCQQQLNTPFDFEQPSLLRFVLFKLQEQHFVCVKTIHHSITDGWSSALLYEAAHRYYDELVAGREPQIEVDQAFFQVQQYYQLNKAKLAQSANELKTQLHTVNDINPLLSNSVDLNDYRRVVQPAVQKLTLNPDVMSEIKQVCLDLKVTTNVFMQFCWHKLLQIYTRDDQTVVGTTVAGRDLPIDGIEQSAGLYINTLPLFVDWQSDNDIGEQLQQITNQILHLGGMSGLPLAQLQGGTERAFHTLLVFENYPLSQAKQGIAAKAKWRESVGKVDYPLVLVGMEYDGVLQLELGFDESLLSQEKASALMAQFHLILQQLLFNPYRSHKHLSILTEPQRKRILHQWNDTLMVFEQDIPCHRLFERQVKKTPEHTAIYFRAEDGTESQVSYYELNEAAEKLADAITLKMTRPPKDQLVALYLQRGPLNVIAILAVLKAGAAYVPISSDYPWQRTQFILADTQAEVLISEAAFEGFWQEHAQSLPNNCALLLADNFELAEKRQDYQAEPNDLAYVIYTSGSTGNPKGVMIEHKSVVNMITGFNHLYNTCEHDRVMQQAATSFDVSVGEIFPVLAVGGALVLVNKGTVLDSEQMAALVMRRNITIMGGTPALLSRLEFNRLPELRLIFSGGEALSLANVEQLLDCATVVNGYGPTEATVGATAYRLKRQAGQNVSAKVPIGKPEANYKIYILDTNLQLLPPGVTGQLCIAGPGLARGYLNRPELTAEQFIEFDGGAEAERIYQTGDLACYLDDGNIQYLGRVDGQIKLRGLRIEIGEIESRLEQHPLIVRAAVVLVGEGHKQALAGFVQLSSGSELSLEVIELWLKDKLPEYMVPSQFALVEELPLNHNGKIDRKALPRELLNNSQTEGVTTPPNSESEIRLAVIWSELLNTPVDDVNSRFFRIGGHSLLAAKLAAEIFTAFQVKLPLEAVFRYSKLADMAAYIDAQTRVDTSLSMANRAELRELSTAQMGLWMVCQLNQQSAAYNMPAVFKVQGKINEAALRIALKQLIERHQLLQVAIKPRQGKPEFCPCSAIEPLKLTELDDTQLLNSWLGVEALKPFDLENGPLFRVDWVKSVEAEVLLFNVHHIVADGVSMALLYHELSLFYNAAIGGSECPLSPLNLQYADYVQAQKLQQSSVDFAEQLEFWQGQLAQLPPLLNLPFDKPRPKSPSYQGDYVQSYIEPSLGQQLKALARQHDCTLYMIVLAAFKTLLYRYSGQNDIAVGTPVSNRNLPGADDVFGLFVNTVVLRSRVDGDKGFIDFIAEVKQTCALGFSHQEVPFDRLVSELGLERHAGISPLFQVMFGLQSQPKGASVMQGVELTPYRAQGLPVLAKFDLTLSVVEQQGLMSLNWEYCTELFERQTIVRLSQNFGVLLRAIVAEQSQPLSQLALLDHCEQTLIAQWNNTKCDFPLDKTVIELFEVQVAKTPENIALIYTDPLSRLETQLTYRQLNEQAQLLAANLQQQGIGAESIVAICMPRSIEMVVAVLAIFKAGGAYLPLDMNNPVERLNGALEDAGAAILLYLEQLPEGLIDGRLTCIDVAKPMAKICLSPVVAQPENLAYIIYTSGSTGKPKGVMIEQRSVVNMICGFNRSYQTTAADRVLQQASLAFDVSVGEILPLLCCGGTVVVPHQSVLADPDLLNRVLSRYDISIFGATPSYLSNLKLLDLPALRLIFSGGEALFCKNIATLGEQAMIVNGYGPTEATCGATAHRLSLSKAYPEGKVPIGKPDNNYRTYVLNEQFAQQPIGVPGQLYIGGVGLARGYHNRSELTGQKFIEIDILGQKQRLYATGDLARWLANGELAFLGRIDTQDKLRGFRIELGEIQARLNRHENVVDCAVIVDGEHSQACLLAYVVLRQPLQDGAGELLRWLRQSLPEHMVPSHIMCLDSLPLNNNGKVDKALLPKPQLFNGSDHAKPKGDSEKQLLAIWRQVLKNPTIGVNSRFFEVGGNSLLTFRVTALANSRGFTLSPRDLFEYQTVRQLADFIDGSGHLSLISSDPVPKRVLLNKGCGTGADLYLLPGSGGLFGYLRPLANRLADQRPVYVLPPPYDTEAEHSIAALAQYHFLTLKQCQTTGPIYLAGHSFGALVAFELAAKCEAAGMVVASLAVIDQPIRACSEIDEGAVMRHNDGYWLGLCAEILAEMSGQELPLAISDLVSASDVQWGYNLLLPWLKQHQIEHLLPTGQAEPGLRLLVERFKRDMLEFVAYRQTRRIKCAIDLYRSEQSLLVAAGGLPEDWGWSTMTSGEVIVNDVKGNHISCCDNVELPRPF